MGVDRAVSNRERRRFRVQFDVSAGTADKGHRSLKKNGRFGRRVSREAKPKGKTKLKLQAK